MYVFVGLIGGSLGYVLSMVIRIEVSLPGFVMLSSSQYCILISFHGILMIFVMLLPVLSLCDDLSFPRINSISFILLVSSVYIFTLSMFINIGFNSSR